MAPVAVTGATGFVGGALVRALRTAGYPVAVLVRDTRRATHLQDLGCRLVHGDLSNPAALNELLDGAHTLIHCAAAVRGASASAFDRPNVEGTAALLDAVTRCETPRLLHLSSLAAREPDLSWYTASKRRAETMLAERAPDRLAWCALRPPAIYGPGDREMLPVWRMASRGWLPIPGNPNSRLSFLHVDDLVEALMALLDPACPLRGECFDISDGHENGYGWRELAALCSEVWSIPVRLLPLPKVLVHGAAWGNLALGRLSGAPPMLSPGKARELMHDDWVCDHRALSEHCGWQPRRQLRESLAALDLHPRPATVAVR